MVFKVHGILILFVLLRAGLHKHMEGLTNDVERSNEMVFIFLSFLNLLGVNFAVYCYVSVYMLIYNIFPGVTENRHVSPQNHDCIIVSYQFSGSNIFLMIDAI